MKRAYEINTYAKQVLKKYNLTLIMINLVIDNSSFAKHDGIIEKFNMTSDHSNTVMFI